MGILQAQFCGGVFEALPRPHAQSRANDASDEKVARSASISGSEILRYYADTLGPCEGRIVRSASIFGAAEVVVVGQRKWRLHGLHGYVSMPQKHFYTVP
jgi:hypothetical protein